MSNVSTEDLQKADQVAYRLYMKLALVVNHARATAEPNPGAKVDKWFNIETPYLDLFKEPARIYRRISTFDPLPMFQLQVLLSIPDVKPGQVLVYTAPDSARAPIEPTPEYILLESWTIDFLPYRAKHNHQNELLNTTPPTMYRHGISLFRSIFSLLRILPTWKLVRSRRRLAGSNFSIAVKAANSDLRTVDLLDFESLARNLRLVRDVHEFPVVLHPAGSLSVSVTYLTSPRFEVIDRELLLSSNVLFMDPSPQPLISSPSSSFLQPFQLDETNRREVTGLSTLCPPTAPLLDISSDSDVDDRRRAAPVMSFRVPSPSAVEETDSTTSAWTPVTAVSSTRRQDEHQHGDSDYVVVGIQETKGPTAPFIVPSVGVAQSGVRALLVQIYGEARAELPQRESESAIQDTVGRRGVHVRESPNVGVSATGSVGTSFIEGTSAGDEYQTHFPAPLMTQDALIALAVQEASSAIVSLPNYEQVVEAAQQSADMFDYWVQCYRSTEHGEEYADVILCAMQRMLDKPDRFTDDERQLLRRTMLKLSLKCQIIPSCLYQRGVKFSASLPRYGGSFSDVFHGIMAEREVALKRLRLYEVVNKDRYWKSLCREALLWRQLHHPCVLEFIGVDECDGAFYMLSPWMKHGTIEKYLQESDVVNPHLKRNWVSQIADGLSYLHENHVVHGDLRGAKILLDENYHVHLADFGLATLLDAGQGTMEVSTWHPGAARWMPLEVLQGGRCTFSGDVYSFACVCLEIATGRLPFHELAKHAQVITWVSAGNRPCWPETGNGDLDAVGSIVTPAWAEHPSQRPSMKDLRERLAL
ncbi:hypothetical protein NM688_g6322 [Phlebia brevispora]|uniref:Uncharacterized protein n=1 Tax=Phlebia brevispora TaxID=194682 RepID=A0ACC1SHA5_9APHY|nr:hypothetical protein NM688_g6322 [Phlebia brevispora]